MLLSKQNQWFGLVFVITLSMTLTSLTSVFAQEEIVLEVSLHEWHRVVIDTVQEGVTRFEEANPGIKVDVRTKGGGWDAFVVRAVAGTPPDILAFNTFNVAELAEAGYLQSLDQFIARTTLESDIFVPMWENWIWNGHTYAIPALETGPRIGLVWNQDMLDESGISIDPNQPLTWVEFLNYADKLTVLDSDDNVVRIGYDPRNGQNSRLFVLAPLLNAPWLDYETNEPLLDSIEFIDGFELFVDRIYRKYPSFQGGGGWYDIAYKTVATTNLGLYAPGEIRNVDPNVKVTVGWPPHAQGLKTQQLFGWGLGIPVGAKYTEESMKLIEFLATDVQFQLDLFAATGFMSAGADFMAELPNHVHDPNILWYINSLAEADEVNSLRPHPIIGKAEGLFNAAVGSIYSLETPARKALEEANRLLRAELVSQGFLD
ncbi:MAG: extracellular solute-binding protein [Limnochordia bacterium]|nr:extracellular solute-binding protein [Limnochordia bacterium]MDD2628971.1 extracellular solute-binding protein [Limnochordia bacterium]